MKTDISVVTPIPSHDYSNVVAERSVEQRNLQRGASSPVWSTTPTWKLKLQKVCDGILALMDESLILSANKGEPREFFYEMKGDYHRFLLDVSMVSQRQAPTMQKERKTVEVPQVQYIDEIIKRVEEIPPGHDSGDCGSCDAALPRVRGCSVRESHRADSGKDCGSPTGAEH